MAKRKKALSSDGHDLPARQTYINANAVHAEKKRIAKRSEHVKDEGKSYAENISWPLATALIREGNVELLKTAMYYRKIYDAAKSDARLGGSGGSGVSIGDGFALDRRTTVRKNGTIAYKEVKQKQSADIDIPAKRYVAPPSYESIDYSSDEIKVSNWSNVPKPWRGDEPVNNMIDAQNTLTSLKEILGVLCEPLEMAVVDGATYQQVGNSFGTADRSGSISAGRALVHMGLIAVRDRLGNIKRGDLS